MPHFDVNLIALEMGVVYQPQKDKLAVALFVRNIDSQGLKDCLPLGAKVGTPEEEK